MFIKLYVDLLDMKSFVIRWFVVGAHLEGYFALHQYLCKFQTNNRHSLFVENKKYVHGILYLDMKNNATENYTLGFVLTNKK